MMGVQYTHTLEGVIPDIQYKILDLLSYRALFAAKMVSHKMRTAVGKVCPVIFGNAHSSNIKFKWKDSPALVKWGADIGYPIGLLAHNTYFLANELRADRRKFDSPGMIDVKLNAFIIKYMDLGDSERVRGAIIRVYNYDDSPLVASICGNYPFDDVVLNNDPGRATYMANYRHVYHRENNIKICYGRQLYIAAQFDDYIMFEDAIKNIYPWFVYPMNKSMKLAGARCRELLFDAICAGKFPNCRYINVMKALVTHLSLVTLPANGRQNNSSIRTRYTIHTAPDDILLAANKLVVDAAKTNAPICMPLDMVSMLMIIRNSGGTKYIRFFSCVGHIPTKNMADTCDYIWEKAINTLTYMGINVMFRAIKRYIAADGELLLVWRDKYINYIRNNPQSEKFLKDVHYLFDTGCNISANNLSANNILPTCDQNIISADVRIMESLVVLMPRDILINTLVDLLRNNRLDLVAIIARQNNVCENINIADYGQKTHRRFTRMLRMLAAK